MKLLQLIKNVGVHEELDGFRAQRIQNYNTTLLVFIIGYLVYIALGIWQGLWESVGILAGFTALLSICFYFGHKGKYTISRYLLAFNAWGVILFFGFYFGYGALHIFLLFATGALWYILFNNTRDLIITQCINGIAAYFLIANQDMDPMVDLDSNLILGFRYLNIASTLIVVCIFIILFKVSNYKFLKFIRHQKKIIEKRQGEIDSSLRYASKIQSVLLPSKSILKDFANDGFIFYQPKDEVSGDFYWTGKSGPKKFLALGDCTGHGIPGAMVSILALSSLDHIFTEESIESPGELLTKLDVRFRNKLRESSLKDGVDITVLMVNEESGEWSFASANSGIMISKKDSFEYLKGEKNPIGLHIDEDITYESNVFSMNEVMAIYLFSDGFPDQFGGKNLPNVKENGKKYGAKRFKKFLQSLDVNKMNQCHETLENHFNEWKGDFEQIDDVCVIGMKVRY